jgi:hypothetical protein
VRRGLETFYETEVDFERCREHLRHSEPLEATGPATHDEVAVIGRSMWRQSVRGGDRRSDSRYLYRALRTDPRKLPLALADACARHHFITYTKETVVPTLRTQLAHATTAGERRRAAGGSIA